MILKVVATGRQWGDKVDARETRQSIAGVACIVSEADAWDGPTEPGGKGQFFRFTSVRPASGIRDDRFPQRVAS